MHEYLIKNCRVVDGTGRDAYQANLAVSAGIISYLGPQKPQAKCVLEGTGKTITPGFIDIHSHGDVSAPYYRYMESCLMQGVTTLVGGQCGYAPAPCNKFWTSQFIEMECLQRFGTRPGDVPLLGPPEGMVPLIRERFGVDFDWRTYHEYVAKLSRQGMGINMVSFVGHGAIRAQVMGEDHRRAATQSEIDAMKEYLIEAMEAGACGLSLGLDYATGCFADSNELLQLCACLRLYQGILAVHWRKTGLRDATARRQRRIDGVREALELARKTGVQLQISHLASGYEIFPSDNDALAVCAARETLRLIEEYRAQGVNVYIDVIPNTTGGIIYAPDLAMALLPEVLSCGTREAFAERLTEPDYRASLIQRIHAGQFYDINPLIDPEWDRVCVILRCKRDSYVNRTILELAREAGIDSVEMVLRLLQEDPYTKVFRPMRGVQPAAIAEMINDPHASIGTDSFSVDLSPLFIYDQKPDMPCYYPNPNTYHGIIHYIQAYPQQRFEDTIHKITGLPARIMRLQDRGTITVGAKADLLLFDPHQLRTNSDLLDPRHSPSGMDYVFVNGVPAVVNGKLTYSLSGQFIHWQSTVR